MTLHFAIYVFPLITLLTLLPFIDFTAALPAEPSVGFRHPTRSLCFVSSVSNYSLLPVPAYPAAELTGCGVDPLNYYGSNIMISFLPEITLAFMITYLLAAISTELAANRSPRALAIEC